MFKLKSSIISIILCGIALTANAESNTSSSDTAAMTPPKPIENKVYSAMVGTWQGTSEMMGKKMREVMKTRWGLNHQFIIMDVKATDVNQSKMQYEGMGVFGVDSQGKAKTSWFDSWGADAMSTGTGDFTGDNKLEITDSNATFKEIRSFEIKGNELIMHAKGTMTSQGKETPFDVTTIYKKK